MHDELITGEVSTTHIDQFAEVDVYDEQGKWPSAAPMTLKDESHRSSSWWGD
jgi:hypothetical protein